MAALEHPTRRSCAPTGVKIQTAAGGKIQTPTGKIQAPTQVARSVRTATSSSISVATT
jgi:hypothetical protein